uniref:Uncharacterized protein n=1 Tax=Ditylenchus dipsaci TaxID=166011 RepID=A0A915DT20_9BILA
MNLNNSFHPYQVMVWWDCFGDKLPLVFVDPGLRFNQAFYRQRILPEVDGAPPHTARLTTSLAEKKSRDSSIKISGLHAARLKSVGLFRVVDIGRACLPRASSEH